MPAWLFGTAFILLSIYGVKSSVGNIGHDAHLGGAIAGILVCIDLEPRILQLHPSCCLWAWYCRRPEGMLVEDYVAYEQKRLSEYRSVKRQIRKGSSWTACSKRCSRKG